MEDVFWGSRTMALTAIGWILIPVGVVLALARPKWLYYLTIFFSPFSATSVFNHGSGDAASGIMPYVVLGALLLSRESAVALMRFRIRMARPIRKFVAGLLLFAAVCTASLIMPVIIDGRLQVMSGSGLTDGLVPLHVTSTEFTNLAGLIFGIVLTALIAQYNIEPMQFHRTLRVYILSGVFISAWGLMQFFLHMMGFSYPYAVFNNSASSGASGYQATLQATDIQRVSSVAMEPSYLAIVLVGMIPILLIAILYKRPIWGTLSDRAGLLVIGLALFLTMSSTGYVGLIALIAFLPFCVSQYRQLRWKLVFGTLLFLGCVVAAFVAVPIVRNALMLVLIDKSTSVSALERLTVISNDLNYFSKYPILGIGWAAAPTHDVIIGLLANCGIIGISSFAVAMLMVGSGLRRIFSGQQWLSPLMIPSLMMFLSLSVTVLSYIISGPVGRGEFWVVLGLSISAIGLARCQREAIVSI